MLELIAQAAAAMALVYVLVAIVGPVVLAVLIPLLLCAAAAVCMAAGLVVFGVMRLFRGEK